MKKQHYLLPKNTIYMCGHSLGPCSKQAMSKVTQALADWTEYAVSAWNISDWIELPVRIGTRIASLLGADADEVVVSDSTSINLYKVLKSACFLQATRKVILTEAENFPANLYIAEGIKNSCDGVIVRYASQDEILNAIDENTAVLLLTHINYRSGFVYDMATITQRAQALGVIVVWDLSHSIGALPLTLSACQVDFAVGCTYKYLNGGPGAPSFIYINKKHHVKAGSPITGWMGHQAPFDFTRTFTPINSAAKYLVGTPYILSLKALEGALETFEDINMVDLREKSLTYSQYLIEAIKECAPSLICQSPSDALLRGGHVAFSHNKAFAITRALISKGVICDYRAPDLLRLCVTPLYLSMEDIKTCAHFLSEIMQRKHYLKAQFQHAVKVT